jgi:group I intron endonuclease
MPLINIENEVIIGRIYKISNKINNMVYIGSTVKPLCKRLGDHIYDLNRGNNMRLYDEMRKIGLKNFKMILLEWKLVDNMEELYMLEQKWIDRENPANLLNSKKAFKNKSDDLFSLKLLNIND